MKIFDFQSQENPHKFRFSVPENLRKIEKVFSACKFSYSEKISIKSKNPCVLPHTKVCGLFGFLDDPKLKH